MASYYADEGEKDRSVCVCMRARKEEREEKRGEAGKERNWSRRVSAKKEREEQGEKKVESRRIEKEGDSCGRGDKWE